MGIFSSIKSAIFGNDDEEEDFTQTKEPVKAPVEPTPMPSAQKKRATVTEVDVEKQISKRPGADKLNWRSSIVDLMKVLDIDPSYENRKQLAGEMGRDDYSGTAEENIWLHKAVMKRIADAGGRVPDSIRY